MKVFIYGGDNGWSIDADRKYTETFLKEIKIKLTKNWINADIIHAVWYSQLNNWRTYFWKKKYIIAVVTNEIEIHNEKFEEVKQKVNLWVVANSKQKKFLESKNVEVVFQPYYVDESIFRPLNLNREEICKELNIDYNKIKNKFIIVSAQRDSLGSDLLKPKWQKDPDLLIEILMKFQQHNSEFILLLAGPRRHYIISKCREYKIPFYYIGIESKTDDLHVNNLSNQKVNCLYNLGDAYIVTSKSEGGPKSIIESSWTKTPILSTNVGIASDILRNDLIFKSSDQALEILVKLNDKEFKKEVINYQYEVVSNQYCYQAFLNRWNKIYKHVEDTYTI